MTIILVLVVVAPMFEGDDRIYAYAIGILVGTLVQLLIPAFDLRNTPFEFSFSLAWRNPNVRRVLLLMLPVTLSLGLINFNLVINSLFGTLVSDEAPAAIDKAFRIYQLPQGIFSVAIATVLFPTLARFASRGETDNLRATMANGMRQILFILVPAAAAILVLSEPMVRLVFERGEFTPDQTDLVATALFWFAFSLPTNGLFLLLTRTFFSLQRPWLPTAIAAGNLAVTALGSLALYQLGVGGIVAATAIATTVSVIAQCVILRRHARRARTRRAARQRDPDLARRRARSPPSASASGTCSTRPWGAASAARSISLGVALALGLLTYLGGGEAAAHRRARADRPPPAPPLDARARVATCWASPQILLLAGFAWLARSRPCDRLVPELSGAPAHLATSVLALAILIWSAELLGTFGTFRAAALPAGRRSVRRRDLGASPAGGARRRGAENGPVWPARRPPSVW